MPGAAFEGQDWDLTERGVRGFALGALAVDQCESAAFDERSNPGQPAVTEFVGSFQGEPVAGKLELTGEEGSSHCAKLSLVVQRTRQCSGATLDIDCSTRKRSLGEAIDASRALHLVFTAATSSAIWRRQFKALPFIHDAPMLISPAPDVEPAKKGLNADEEQER
ncbi:hypothetical protein N2152v2_008093 [Parachlorella kessleri]